MRALKVALAVLLLASTTIYAQAPNAQRTNQAAAQTKLAGRVVDPSGAVMLGVDIKLFQGATLVKESKTDDRGTFSIEVPPGQYRVEVSAPDFKTINQEIRIVPNMSTVSISMSLATVATQIDVGSKKDEVTIDDDANMTSTTISGDAVQDLPEAEDALTQQLQAIAAGSGAAGANASFVIDGISGGRVPPRDQIQSI